MKEINITIPDNLEPKEEVLAIAQKLDKKILPLNQKRIGESFDVKHLQTVIIVNRKPIEKPIILKECSVCSSLFEKKNGKGLWVNYGGTQKRKHYCSEGCRDTILKLVGTGRAAIKKQDLNAIRPT